MGCVCQCVGAWVCVCVMALWASVDATYMHNLRPYLPTILFPAVFWAIVGASVARPLPCPFYHAEFIIHSSTDDSNMISLYPGSSGT